jgi:hypothetical protein
MRPSEKVVDVIGNQLVVTENKHIDLIRHVYARNSDREVLKDIHSRLVDVERGAP